MVKYYICKRKTSGCAADICFSKEIFDFLMDMINEQTSDEIGQGARKRTYGKV